MLNADVYFNIHARQTEHGMMYRVAKHAYEGQYVTEELTEDELRHWLNRHFDAERNKVVNAAVERARLTGNSNTPTEARHDLNGVWEDGSKAQGRPPQEDPQPLLTGFAPLEVRKPVGAVTTSRGFDDPDDADPSRMPPGFDPPDAAAQEWRKYISKRLWYCVCTQSLLFFI